MSDATTTATYVRFPDDLHEGTRQACERRRLLKSLALAGLAASFRGRSFAADDGIAAIADMATIDIHSHAGGVIGLQRVNTDAPFSPVAAPMREGGMAVLCLASVSDAPTHHVTDDRKIRPFRDPDPGELHAYGQRSFERIHALAAAQDMPLVRNAVELAAARSSRPSIVVTAEGGDFIEDRIDRLDEAYERWALRHLQLVHYRVNALGDIQTEATEHDGLTAFGADVIRRCNRLGIVVDVAHGTEALVRKAAAATGRPLVLSHTSLASRLGFRTRLVSATHARIVADTGGVVGIWPPASLFPDLAALAAGMARMVDAIGIDHVALGTDLRGLVGPSVFTSYRDLPALAHALLARGFQVADVRKLLGGNYLRVFAASA